ncbi:ADP-ribosylglycohydrolase family protein [Bacillota bacterium Meth-B3]
MNNQILEKIYAGFLGMNIGIRLGAPVEPTIWTYERIQRTYGEITGYVKDFNNFAADDDANGPVFFLRALYDQAHAGELTAQDVAEAWLNYAREGVGMFWWGGYGVSTEHTAYLNLKHGVPAPRSGSIAQNGQTLAEQIGGQIFIDTWGLVWPGNPEKAAEYAARAASVSHDGDGIHGAAFMAACIARAFDEDDMARVAEEGLAHIPEDCTYAKVVRAVEAFHRAHPGDWRLCRDYLESEWGYDRYGGACHIIPNAGVCAMALYYGNGSFARIVEIAAMAGWDTDCNAGNVGTVAGVSYGLEAIPGHYRAPINDGIVLSGISGYLNILDIPNYARELHALSRALRGEAPMPEPTGEIRFDFGLPGSTHNFRVSDPFFCRIAHDGGSGVDGGGCLAVLFDRMQRGDTCRVYYKPFYRRADFSDERYSPVFSPTAYPGQTVRMMLRAERWNGESVYVAPYVRNTDSGEIVRLGGQVITDDGWRKIEFVIPDMDGSMIDEIGVELSGNSPAKHKDLGRLLIDEFSVSGKARYRIAMARQKKEFGAVTPFAMDRGAWSVEDGRLCAMCLSGCEAVTGNYFARDARVRVPVIALTGEGHLASLRVQGARRGYYAGLAPDGKAAIYKKQRGAMTALAEAAYPWVHGRAYALSFEAAGDHLTLSVDGRPLLSAVDADLAYGMCGVAVLGMGRTLFGDLEFEEM